MLPTTKAGPGDKEPAYIILRKHLFKIIALVVLVGICAVLRLSNNSYKIEKLQTHVHGIMRNLQFTNRKEKRDYASMIAKFGEEVEEHLDRDIKESELGNEIVGTISSLKSEYLVNVTNMINVATGLNAETQSQETAAAMQEARDALKAGLEREAASLFKCLDAKVGALVKRLAREAKRAEERRTQIQDEIVKQLKKSQNFEEDLEHHTGDLDGDGWVEDLNGDGIEDHPPMYDDDDEQRHLADQWHNDTVNTFFEHLDRYLNERSDPNSTAVPAMDMNSHLYEELKNALDHLRSEQASWSDIQDLLHARKDSLAEAGLPAFEDAEPVSDDEHTYAQHWHVQNYLDEVLWPSKLIAYLPLLKSIRTEVQTGAISPVKASGDLEEMAFDEVFPHHWLHHMSGDDMYYRHYHY